MYLKTNYFYLNCHPNRALNAGKKQPESTQTILGTGFTNAEMKITTQGNVAYIARTKPERKLFHFEFSHHTRKRLVRTYLEAPIIVISSVQKTVFFLSSLSLSSLNARDMDSLQRS